MVLIASKKATLNTSTYNLPLGTLQLVSVLSIHPDF